MKLISTASPGTFFRSVKRLVCIAFALLSFQPVATAEIPAEYRPIVVEAPFSFFSRVFDLTSAVDKAKEENKPLYIYLGAGNCPPCRFYGHFLEKNSAALKDTFDRLVVVDIRTPQIRGPKLVFKVGENQYSFEDFKSLVGDKNNQLTYPYFWYVSPELKQIKQLPRGSDNYLTVEKQLEILALPSGN